MRRKIGPLAVVLAVAASAAFAQQPPKTPNPADIYCSGMATVEGIPHDIYLISGEQSNYKVTFAQGDLVYLNRGSDDGVKVGDEFLMMRPVANPLPFNWSKWQSSLLRAMGTMYLDLGRARVVNAQANVAIAEVVFSCDYMQRGDIARPFAERPAPPFKDSANFDRFAPASGKPLAMVATAKGFAATTGANSVMYVNLGSAQGVKAGDYFRIFRYQGTHAESVYQSEGTAYQMYGYGSARKAYTWKNLPREILGEGIVLRTSPNSSTVLVTVSLREIYAGDYVELE